MKRRIAVFAALAALVVAPSEQSATAATNVHLGGGGTASISQVAFNVSIGPAGGASGSFECLMAGRSSFVLGAFGLAHSMILHATPTAGSIGGSVATFSGPGSLLLDGNVKMSVHVQVWVNAATQQFQLTVVEVGAMPVETFTSGGVSMS